MLYDLLECLTGYRMTHNGQGLLAGLEFIARPPVTAAN